MSAFNAAADWLAGEAFARKTANKFALQKLHYQELRRRFGLSAQMAVRCIAQACEAYRRDGTKRPNFRQFASIPYDQRLMSFKAADRVSLLTLSGRITVTFVMGRYQRERFAAAKGQCDLVCRRDGKWFLLVTVDLPDGAKAPATDFLGVDLGVANLAADSDGGQYSGWASNRAASAATPCAATCKRPPPDASGVGADRSPFAASCAACPAVRLVFAKTSTIESPSRSLPRPKAPDAESPWKN